MAANDCAILVGISQYFDSTLPQLKSPPNDVARMQQWLLDSVGGAVPQDNIHVLTSPNNFASDLDPSDWPPGEADYTRTFRRIASDPTTNQFLRRQGRLYLFFSGHGFSERRDQATRAALYAAGATRSFPANICGTFWALAAKQSALFQEIVLVMDCCRDAELNVAFSQPAINLGMADNQAAVKFLAIYAAPKGGKAQERQFPELGGMTCGLLTHSFLKALKEAPADDPVGLSSMAIQRYMLSTWAALCANKPAPEPQFTQPENNQIVFPAAQLGVDVGFKIAKPAHRQLMVEIRDRPGNSMASCSLAAGATTVTYPGIAPVTQPLADGRFAFRLQPAFYRCTVSGDVTKTWLFEADGVSPDVEL